ncbi:MAG TPA: helicase-associated domain-containing protein [Pseudonocardiaceae bacterium]|jgi:hypothetical protein
MPEPDPLPFPVTHAGDDEVVLRPTEHAALADLGAVLQLCAAGRLRCSEKTRRPSAATMAQVAHVLSAGEFYSGEAIASFAWPLLLQAGGLAELAGTKLVLTERGNKALSRPGAETIRHLWRRWIAAGVIDEFSRIDTIKGQRKARALTAVKPRRGVVAQALARCCPQGQWVSIEEMFAAMCRGGYDPEVSRGTNVWKLYLDDPEHGSLGYDGHHDWEVLQGRYTLAVLFEYAATLGLVDVGYAAPDNARVGDLPDYLDYYFQGPLSRYDGLLAVRLTPLGAYALGLSTTYQPGPPPAGESGGLELKVLNNLDVVVTGTLMPADTMLLDAFAERTSDRVWTLTTTNALAALDTGRQLSELATFLRRAEHQLPQTVTQFLTDLAGRASRLSNHGLTRLVECTDPALAIMIARDRNTSKLCRPVGDRHLAVPVEHDTAFRKAVQTLGYVLPPNK